MSWNQTSQDCLKYTNTSEKYDLIDFIQKPIEIYVFIDPLSPECWSLEPYLKKLIIEYGQYFTIRQIMSGHLKPLSKKKSDKLLYLKDIREDTATYTKKIRNKERTTTSQWLALAIKAAELQGMNAGKLFLRKVQEHLFLKDENVFDEDIIIHCAKESNLDIQEFKTDHYSIFAKRALICDLSLTREMDVDYTPTVVFFNQIAEEQGVKIAGIYSYDIYVLILQEMLQKKPLPAKKPSLESFLESYGVVSNQEVSIIYDWTPDKADRKMKKLQIKQKVKRMLVKNEVFWKYIYKED